MKYGRLILTFALSLVATMASAKPDDNIVLENVVETYTIIATKDGSSIEKVKVRKELTFTAQRVNEKAVAVEFYNSFISIDKASAPDTRPVYLSDIDEGIFYDDSKLCGLSFDVKTGKTATARFDLTYLSPEYFTTIGLSESYYTRSKMVKIIVPQSLASTIRIIEKSLTPAFSSTVDTGKKGERIYTYAVSNMEKVKKEEDSPHLSTIVPRLYVVGHFADCQALYNYLRAFTSATDPGIDNVNCLARELTETCTTTAQRIERITHWVHQYIRYIAVEHGEYGQRPDLAGEVLRKRYGDCKGMSALLKAMFQAVEIDARMVWIGTRDIAHDWSEVPSLCSGNHMICAIVDGDSILYIDGTAAYQPIGMYPHSIQGQQALIENGDSYILHRLPCQSPGDNCDYLKARMSIDGENLVGRLENTLTGMSHTGFCVQLNSTDASKRNDYILNYMSYPRKNARVTDVIVTGDSIADTETTITVNSVETGACQHLGDAIYVELLPFRTGIIDTYDLKERTLDISLPNPRRLVSDFTLDIPEGFAVESLPDEYTIDNQWISAHIGYSVEADKVHCNATLTIKDNIVPLAMAKTWNTVARQFKQANTQQITLKKITP